MYQQSFHGNVIKTPKSQSDVCFSLRSYNVDREQGKALIRYGKIKSAEVPCSGGFSEIDKQRIKNNRNIFVDPDGELHCLFCIKKHKCVKGCPCAEMETYNKYVDFLKHIYDFHIS